MQVDRQKIVKRSRFAAKLAVKLFILVLFLGLAPFMLDEGMNEQIRDLRLVVPRPWTLVFPGLLTLGFLALLTVCIVQKFRKSDINWLLTLNTVILLAYAVIAYIRIFRFI